LGEHFGAIIKINPHQNFILLEGFWSSSNWKANCKCASIPTIVDVDLEDHFIPLYRRPRSMCSSLNIIAYMPFHDLFVANFVFVRVANPTFYPMWMERAENDVERNQKNDNYRKVYVQ
jgi:hypothetical protein